MTTANSSREELLEEIESLRVRLEETEDTLRAIGSGEVDAFVVSGPDGEQVFTLRGADQPYRVLVETMNEGAANLAADGTILYCNSRLADMLQIPLEMLVGTQFGSYVPSADHNVFKALLEKCPQEPAKDEIVMITGDGNSVPVLISSSANNLCGSRGISVVVYDISIRKRAEEENAKLAAQLQQTHKMEAVGRLAGGVAHDFNNMLNVILGYSEIALGRINATDPLHGNLEEIRKAAERSADLTRQLLSFARKQTIAPRVLDLNETVSGMLKLLQRLIGEDIHLKWQPEEGLWPVKVDPSQIDQILANLCINARDAIVGVGRITIETGNTTFDEEYCEVNGEFVPGEYVQLTVSDNGCGMNKETLSHLFEPFFTTKAPGKGTGLGLAMVYGIVRQNNGFIKLYSEPDHGTTFKIYLPRFAGKDVQARREGAARPALRGHETILLVEDEPSILNLTTQMLEMSGYSILAASTPGEAIRMAREHAGEIHLLMTDVIMPEMNGRDLAKNLLSLYPDLKRLFMSGYTADVIAHQGVLDEGVYFIQKPFSIQSLTTKVREVLDSK
jgi:PAS domain S-box-containing protein